MIITGIPFDEKLNIGVLSKVFERKRISKLVNYPVPDFVWEEFWLDQEINARGIQLDLTMVENAISLDEISKEKLVAAMREITDLDNPNSVAQMKVWLAEQGVEAESLGKKDVAKLMDEVEGDVKDALLLRQ